MHTSIILNFVYLVLKFFLKNYKIQPFNVHVFVQKAVEQYVISGINMRAPEAGR